MSTRNWFDTQANYSHINTPSASIKGQAWDSIGKALQTIGALSHAYGKNDDEIALANIKNSGATDMGEYKLFDPSSQEKFNEAIATNKAKADADVLSKVYSGEITQNDFKPTKETIVLQKEELDDGQIITPAVTKEVQVKPKYTLNSPEAITQANSYFKQKQDEAQQKVWDANKIDAISLIDKHDNFSDIVESFRDEDGKIQLDLDTQKYIYTELIKKSENKKKIDANKALETQKHNNKLEQIDRENSHKTDEDKNQQLIEKNIINQKNEDKISMLSTLKKQLKNKEITQSEYDAKTAELSKTPLSDKQLKNIKVIKEQLRNLQELKTHYDTTGKGWIDKDDSKYVGSIEGAFNEYTPTASEGQRQFDALMQKVLLDKTSLLSGTLSDKDMSILNASGLTANLGEKDFEKELARYIKATEDELSSYETYLSSRHDMPQTTQVQKNNPQKKQRKQIGGQNSPTKKISPQDIINKNY